MTSCKVWFGRVDRSSVSPFKLSHIHKLNHVPPHFLYAIVPMIHYLFISFAVLIGEVDEGEFHVVHRLVCLPVATFFSAAVGMASPTVCDDYLKVN